MASPADYMKDDDDDELTVEQIPVEMPCEIVETTVVDQNGRQIIMAPAQGLSKNDNAMLLQAGHQHHQLHQHHHHQDLEDGQLTYVYESVVPQELYAEPESPAGPSRYLLSMIIALNFTENPRSRHNRCRVIERNRGQSIGINFYLRPL